MFPLVKIHGGGYYNRKFVISLFPSNYEDLIYKETCIGGGSILGYKKPSKREIICDIDPNLFSIYWSVQNNPDWFQKTLRSLEYSQETFDAAKNGTFHKAINEYVLRRMSLSGRMDTFAKSKRQRGGQQEGKNAWENSITALDAWHKRLAKVSLYNYEILESMHVLTGEFVYIDPPFLPETRQSKDVYPYEMTKEDHEDMLKILTHESNLDTKILLAGYASELYRDYLELTGWTRHDKSLTNHSSQAKTKSKKILSLWRNY